MSEVESAISSLLILSSATLFEIAEAIEGGVLKYGFSPHSLSAFVGSNGGKIDSALRTVEAAKCDLPCFCRALALALREREAAEAKTQIVLSGPEIPGVPVVDTRTTVLSLFEEAKREVVISSYVFHQSAKCFARLAEKHDADLNFRVVFIADISHRRTPECPDLARCAQSFAKHFRNAYWPGKRVPEVWFDPRFFEPDGGGVLHSKAVIIDRDTVLISSANFTEAAQSKNIEAGVLLRNHRAAERLYEFFHGLIANGILRKLPYLGQS